MYSYSSRNTVMLHFWALFKCYVSYIGCSCWFSVCCCVECCTWCKLLFLTKVRWYWKSRRSLFVWSGIWYWIENCSLRFDKDFIISPLERSSFWRKSWLSSSILQHLWGWFSNFFRAPLSEVVSESILLLEVDSSHLK